MDKIKQLPLRFRVRLENWAEGGDAWGTIAGLRAYGEISQELLTLAAGTVVVLDYGGVTRADVSFQREAVAHTLGRHRPELAFVGVNVNDQDVLSNLSAALQLRGQRLLVHAGKARATVLGEPLSDEHLSTLSRVEGRPGLTTSDLVGPPLGLETSTASARLALLWKAGLVRRFQVAAPSGGKQYEYYPIV